ncbi:MAG: family ATPase [Rhodospirillales bacterium]|nr:family ATPase [Rhodospirillales bacterium]
MTNPDFRALAERAVAALERLAPAPAAALDLARADAFMWHGDKEALTPVPRVNRVALDLLRGVDRQSQLLLENTRRFARGLPANNALLWGARGMGKSSLVKAVHATLLDEAPGSLVLIEVQRDELTSLAALLALLRASDRRAIVFVDDLSFETEDAAYKSLKAVLEGGLEGRPANVLFYATSNRRHLMPREMIDNERSSAIHPGEAVEEKVSLSDRFGLWLGFHACDQATYLAMVDSYAARFGLGLERDALHAEANAWSVTRGARSGRVAWQFVQDLAGRLGKTIAD